MEAGPEVPFPGVLANVLSRVQLIATPWTVAHQAPPSMGFPRQEYESGWPFPSPADHPEPLIKPALVGGFFTTEPPVGPLLVYMPCVIHSLESRQNLHTRWDFTSMIRVQSADSEFIDGRGSRWA